MIQNQSFQENVYQKILSQRVNILRGFQLLYFLIGVFWLISAYMILTNKEMYGVYYEWGILLGKTALVVLSIVILPGILGRFNIQIKLTRIITVFRRQLGILTFLIAFTHFSFTRLLAYATGIIPFQFPFQAFEIAGFSALFIMSFLFLTSNNMSVKKLGKWWKRLHRFIYIIIWLVVLHVGLQRMSIWTILIFVFAVLETTSLIYSILVKRRI